MTRRTTHSSWPVFVYAVTILLALANRAVAADVTVESAKAAFAELRPAKGLQKWKQLEQGMDAAQIEALTRSLMKPAAESICLDWLRDKEQEAAYIEILQRLTASNISRGQWKELSYPVCRGWVLIRERSQRNKRVDELDSIILRRVTEFGDLSSLACAMGLADRNKELAQQIDPAMLKLASTRLPREGLANTQQGVLIAAAIRHNRWPRVRQYVAALNWDPSTPDDARAVVGVISDMLDQVGQIEDPGLMEHLVDQFGRMDSLPLDDQTKSACQSIAVKSGVALVREGRRSEKHSVTSMFGSTISHSSAPRFWDGTMKSLLAIPSPAPEVREHLIKASLEIGELSAKHFSVTDYMSTTYLRIAQAPIFNPRTQSPYERIAYVKKALDSAETDEARIQAVREVARIHNSMGEHQRSREVVAEWVKLLPADAQARASGVVDEISADEARFKTAQAILEKQLQSERLKGQATHLRERVEEAKRENRPAEELESLRLSLERVERDLKAVGG